MIRHIEFANLCNFRDVGGYAAQDGRTVRWQRLYRADSLGWLAGDDLPAFHALRVRTVIDLRHPFEVERAGRVPETEGLRYRNLPVEGRRWNLAEFREETGVERYLADRYLEVTEDGVDNLRAAVETVAVADNAPVVIHCAAGKDRTGLLTALILSLVGVAEDDIVADYALTGLATERFISDWRTRHPDAPMWPGFGLAPAQAMRLFLDDLTERHGSVQGYVTDVLQVDRATVAGLRENLLTDSISRG
ncbi:tyrosine-protein phosphatase [Nonomuraea spiralis]|uniref:tyrosine-protein phosphatase n=1 Tax=Nonomuraea TaxID=83681 RepID=UPI000F7B1263|nr:tyrosine-protein phosphatase [Nonomuraea sp. WAC 01424]RSN03503.1 protein tyrosine phosphatase [Nonomuraea sp. WAC 01424]